MNQEEKEREMENQGSEPVEVEQHETEQHETEQQEIQEQQKSRVRYQVTRPRMGMGSLVIPILIYFIISVVVEFVLGIILMQSVMVDYLNQSAEYVELIGSFTETSTFSEMMDAMKGFMTDEVVMDIMDQLSSRMGEFATYTTIVSGVLSIPAFAWMMRRDRKKIQSNVEGMILVSITKKVSAWKYGIIAVGTGSICVALNNFIKLMNLASYSEGYQVASENLYSVPFAVQLIGLGMIVPIAEELLFRGVLYRRIKVGSDYRVAMLWSSMLFAMFHGNLVQMVYGFICGLILVWLYEVYGSIKAPILGHICMNIVSVLLTQYDVFYWIFEDPLRVGIITVVSATLASVCYVMIKETVINDTKMKVEKL